LRDYEILFIARPELDEEQLAEAVKTVDNLIANLGGVSEKSNVWGKRRLAYEVDHLREGHYVLTDFKLEPGRLGEMEATLKISETIFRHLIVRKPDKVRPAPAAAEPAVEPVAEPAAAEPAAEIPAAAQPEEPPPAEPEAVDAGPRPAKEQQV
jgi:small subunit ribosomal protein S6